MGMGKYVIMLEESDGHTWDSTNILNEEDLEKRIEVLLRDGYSLNEIVVYGVEEIDYQVEVKIK